MEKETMGCIGPECQHFQGGENRPYCAAKRLNRMPEDFSGKMRQIQGGFYFYPEDAIKRGLCVHAPGDQE